MTDDNGKGKVEAAKNEVRLEEATRRIEDAASKLESIASRVTAQQRALLVALLWRAGALTPDLRVRPVDEWRGEAGE